MKKKSILFILIILFVSMLAVSQVSAEDTNNMTLTEEDTLEVTDCPEEIEVEDGVDYLQTSESEDLLSGEDDKSFDDIQTMINNAEDGDTIELSGRYVGNGKEITIDKDITLVGDENYTYLDSDGNSRIFYVTASDVMIQNMVLRHGDAEYYDGGAAYGGSYYNCLFGYSKAGSGGALANAYAENCFFALNNADNQGGAVYNCNIYNCLFTNNTANQGGAIYLDGDYEVSHCEFQNNTADMGGAIYFNSGQSTVSNSKFAYNNASSNGGAVYAYYSGLEIDTCDFRFNYAENNGGAVYSDHVDTIVRNSYFWENKADNNGGALYDCICHDSSIYLNKAGNNGGGMYSGESHDCLFAWNTPQDTYSTTNYVSIKGKITLSQSGSYFGGKTLTVKVINSNTNNPVSGVNVYLKFSNGNKATVTTGSNGVATYKIPFNPGTYKVTATMDSDYSAPAVTLSNIKIAKAPVKLSPSKLKTYYQANKYFKVKVINTKTNKAVSGVKLLFKIYTGKKAKKVYATTCSNGVASYNAHGLKVGKHKVKISISSSQVSGKAKTSKIKVKKAKTKIYAPKDIIWYKSKSGKSYVYVINKHTGDLIKGMKLKVKIYTGKKAKTYKIKTNKKGVGIIKTKSIKIGKHKVVITAKGNSKYKKSSAKGTIEISKKIPTYVGYNYMLTTYSYGYYISGRSVSTYLKDYNGKTLHKKLTIVSSDGGKTTGYSGDMISLPSIYPSYVIIKFAGDKKYRPSQYRINFV